MHAALRGVSVDVITEYAFEDCWGQLDRSDLGEWYSDMVRNMGVAMWVLQMFPLPVLKVVDRIPRAVAGWVSLVIRDTLDCKVVSSLFLFDLMFSSSMKGVCCFTAVSDDVDGEQKTKLAVEKVQREIDNGYKPPPTHHLP